MAIMPDPAVVAEIRQALWSNGYRPVPLLNYDYWQRFDDSDPKAKADALKQSGKKPIGKKWPELARRDPPNCLAFAPVLHALNTGVLSDGLQPFDVDIDDPDLAAAVQAVLVGDLGDAPRRYRINSSRFALVYAAADGEPVKHELAGRLGKIEVLGRGQQCVVHGIHVSGAAVEWQPPLWTVPRNRLIALPRKQVDAVLAKIAPMIGAEVLSSGRLFERGNGRDAAGGDLEAPVERIVALLEAIPNDGPPDWEFWNKVGMAVFRASGGCPEALHAWTRWTEGNPWCGSQDPAVAAREDRKGPPDYCTTRWKNYLEHPPGLVGVQTLQALANEAREWLVAGFGEGGKGNGAEQNRATAASDERPTEDDKWERTGTSDTPGLSDTNQQYANSSSFRSPWLGTPDDDNQSLDEDDWPEPMAAAAFHGLTGEIIETIAPHTEADPHGLLLNLLVRFGNKIGRGPHYFVEDTPHATNEYVLLAGKTSRARKDTSANRIQALFMTDVRDLWFRDCCQPGGLASGEGVIHAVRDERWGLDKKGERVRLDEGVKDKRLLVVESEFASVLAVMRRENSTLSAILRSGWDRGDLRNLTKNNSERATGVLLSILSHITVPELRAGLDRIALSNGLMNRFLFALIRRVRHLAHGGSPDITAIQRLGVRLEAAIVAARKLGRVSFTPDAAALWSERYEDLTADQPGLFGSLIARAEAHTVRLALLYALADQAQTIGVKHLEAAFAVWRYSEASARVLFGSLVGDPTADSLLVFLRAAGNGGMTRTELIHATGRNITAARIQLALQLLLKQGLVRFAPGGRAGQTGPFAERWYYLRRTVA
jgi:hypothetical protein